jgi:hypothetical protein
MKALPFLLLMVAGVADGEALRISEVREVAGDGTERMTLHYRFNGEDKEEELFVLKEGIVGDKDVAQAWVHPGGGIGVKLKPDGAKAMTEATKDFIPGRTRLAVIVDGELVSAPGVRATLGGNFEISGMEDLDPRALENLARRMSGRPVLEPGEALPQAPPPPPHPEMVPFTEEEYQQNKANREKVGIYHLERVPSKDELDAKLRKGIDRDAVIAAVGNPCFTLGKSEDGKFQLLYKIAPEKREENPGGEPSRDGFEVRFSDGKVSEWEFSSSFLPRARKLVGRAPGLLVATYPKADLGSGKVDPITLIEGIKIPNVRQRVNATDLQELLSLARMASTWESAEGKEEPRLSRQCDFMKILALHFPEAQDLVDGAVDGKVTVKSLGAAMSPYVVEGKPLPDVKPAPADGN